MALNSTPSSSKRTPWTPNKPQTLKNNMYMKYMIKLPLILVTPDTNLGPKLSISLNPYQKVIHLCIFSDFKVLYWQMLAVEMVNIWVATQIFLR